MKQLKSISIIVILVLCGCSKSVSYSIEKKFKSVVNNENCKIEFYYPKFISSNIKLKVDELNELLENNADYEYYIHNCNEIKKEKEIIEGDFKVTLKADNILSIEFITKLIHYEGTRIDTIYHSIVLNPKKIQEKEFSFLHLEPEMLFPNFDRETLVKYVKKFNETHNQNINLLAYKTGSKYSITWGVSANKFILYVGGEGEWFGYNKIEIPINEIKKKTNIYR